MAVAVALLALAWSPPARAADSVVQRFSVSERFGVSHPEQILTFDLNEQVDETEKLYVLNGDEKEVPYQLLEEGKTLAVRTALSADEKRSWTLRSGRSSSFRGSADDLVQLNRTDGTIQLTNGRTGVRLARPPGNREALKKHTPAPLQAIRLPDGSWTRDQQVALNPSARSMETRVLEQGPLRTVVRIRYRLKRPEIRSQQQENIPAGEGYYQCTVTLEAGQPSVIIEEEGTAPARWRIDLYPSVKPTRARYRGHHATEKRFGRTPDGNVYPPHHKRGSMDAIIDLPYDNSHRSAYRSSDNTLARLARWNPWARDTGWYWMIFNEAAGPEAPLVGIFAGRASRLVGAGNSGVGVFTGAPEDHGGERAAGLSMQINLRAPNATLYEKVRFQWGLYTNRKENGLRGPKKTQPINRQMNLHGGINLQKLKDARLTFPDPSRGWGAMFMPRDAIEYRIRKIRSDEQGKHGNGYFSRLWNEATKSRDLLRMWADRSGSEAQEMADAIRKKAREMLHMFVHEGGIYEKDVHYWHGGLKMSRAAPKIDQTIASNHTGAETKKKLKRVAALYGQLLQDNDWVPLFKGHGVNLGNPNMPVQQTAYRRMYTLMLSEHPRFTERASKVTNGVKQTVRRTINEHGAHMGSVHYVNAAMGPVMTLLQQMQMAGVGRPFENMSRLEKFGRFYLNFTTPPEPRFGGRRKLVAIGDGSTERSTLTGTLGTALRNSAPETSKKLMRNWRDQGRPHSSFHASTLLRIDGTLPGASPELGDAHFPGYYTVLRHGYGTDHETATWMVNGADYRDHYHQDLGSVTGYALGAPLSIDWGSIYYPRVAGGYMHSQIQPVSALKQKWNAPVKDLNTGVRWSDPSVQSVRFLKHGSRVTANFAKGERRWQRTVTSIHVDPDRPILLIRDTFPGTDRDKPMVFTLNLMAEGAVDTPAGSITPNRRSWGNGKKQHPDGGEPVKLAGGLNRLGFSGQWKIDWDLYTRSGNPQRMLIDNWAHHWHPNTEQGQFKTANNRPFEERQHIMRLHDDGPFHVMILPRRKGEKPKNRSVQLENGRFVIERGGSTTRIGNDGFHHRGDGKHVVAAWSDAPVSGGALAIQGGAGEIVVHENEATVTLHGEPGERRITFPGDGWTGPQNAEKQEDGTWFVPYEGGDAGTLRFHRDGREEE